MGNPYVGEIRMFAGNFAPEGWMFCQGQILNISDQEPLYSVIGSIYGFDGDGTFALPDLRGRVPVQQGQLNGNKFTIGTSGGDETVTLMTLELPVHSHKALAESATGTSSPTNAVWAVADSNPIYTDAAPALPMDSQALLAAGGNQPHENMIPYLAINFIICLNGYNPTPDDESVGAKD